MSTVLSALKHNEDSLVNIQLDHQKSHQIYSTHFNDSLNAQSVTPDFDFNLSDTIKRAVNLVKQKQFASRKHYRNIKYPCGVCAKSVNKNQKVVYCNNCLNWYHRKCNGISLAIDEMASKFPSGYLSIIELNELYGVDLPSQLELLRS